MPDLEQRWFDLALPLEVNRQEMTDWWEVIRCRYSERQRHYHTLDHLREMFKHFDQQKHKLKRQDLVSLAIFFHDVIYDPTERDNEEQSADLFVKFIQESSSTLKSADVEKVKTWILLTKSHNVEAEGSDDQHYFLDIDMAVLGRPESDYMVYANQIREEYIHVPEKEYRTRRSQVLADFCERSRLFATKDFHDQYNSQAKENMKSEISKLLEKNET